MRKWFYRNWSIERIEKKCRKGYAAVIESGYLVGFKKENKED